MLELLGTTQRQLMGQLLRQKLGATIDELSQHLAITRNAVRQHLSALENEGMVKKSATRASGGRPEQLYALTEQGHECFPRRYAWFAQLLLTSVTQEGGDDQMDKRLREMGTQVGTQLRERHPALRSRADKVQALAGIMEELGYDARPAGTATDAIEADNCVFHALAMGNPHVCQFDLALMQAFTGDQVDHQQCMASGDGVCRFKFVRAQG